MPAKWEYDDFVWTDPRLAQGYASSGILDTARKEWWSDARSSIMPELQKRMDEGWEPTTAIGPEAWEIEESRVSTVAHWGCINWVFWVISLVPSFGLTILFLFQQTTVYKPVAFRVQMKR